MKRSQALHRWRLTAREAVALQFELAKAVVLRPLPALPRLVAGLDCAFSDVGRRCHAAAVVWDIRRREVVEQATVSAPLRFPYVPGLLSFREAPALLKAVAKLRTRPDAVMCDGQGLAHPRRFGLACHLGLWVGLPTVGCAKSRLVGEHAEPGPLRGDHAALRIGRDVVGAVLRTRNGVRPVYVSPGHLIDLASARRLVLACCVGYRIPEPTRLADIVVARAKAGAGGGCV